MRVFRGVLSSAGWAGAVLLLALALPAGGLVSQAHAAPLQAGCAPAGYSNNGQGCVVVPTGGSFSMKIPGTKAKILGHGSKNTAGTQITVVKVPVLVRSKGGFGLRVRATGKFNPLRVSPGKLYRYNAAKNGLIAAKFIKSPGLFQITK